MVQPIEAGVEGTVAAGMARALNKPASAPSRAQRMPVSPIGFIAALLCVFWLAGVLAYVAGALHGAGAPLGSINPYWLGQTAFIAILPPALVAAAAQLAYPAQSYLRALADWRRAEEPETLLIAVPARDLEKALGYRHIARTSWMIVLGFAGVFLAWAALAPLASATMAPGVVVVESHRKTIQHLEGGIVRDVLVMDGDTVDPGQPLLELENTQAKTSFDMLQGQSDALGAAEARLTAERDIDSKISFPPELLARASDPKISEAMRGEEAAFRSHRETMGKQIDILTAHGKENERTIEGLKAQQTALDTQLSLIGRETGMIEALVNKGIEALPRLLQLQRTQADLGGQRGQVIEKISQINVNTGELQLQIVNLRNQFLSDTLKELRDVQTRRFDLSDRMLGAKDVLARTVLTAPVGGRIVGLSVHTKGAVIRPGDTLMEIVPGDDALEVESHVRPEDINYVHIGMPAKVTLTSYQQRRLPMITGTVTTVSPDRLTDQHTGQAYFNALVSVDRKSLDEYPEVRLLPGMPAEVALETGSRTMLEYFIMPIEGVLRRGMREK